MKIASLKIGVWVRCKIPKVFEWYKTDLTIVGKVSKMSRLAADIIILCPYIIESGRVVSYYVPRYSTSWIVRPSEVISVEITPITDEIEITILELAIA